MPIDDLITKWCGISDGFRDMTDNPLAQTLADMMDGFISDLQESRDQAAADAEEHFRLYGR